MSPPPPLELTEEQEDLVDRALGPYAPSEVLADAFRLQITRRDMATLSGLNWLNDEVHTDHSGGQVTDYRSLTTCH